MSQAKPMTVRSTAKKPDIRRDPRMLFLQLRTLIALFILVVIFSFTAPAFLTTGNLIILVKQLAINAILGIGMTFVILTGGIDLSVGSIVGICGMIAGGLINEGLVLPIFGVSIFFNIPIVMLLTLLVGMFIGMINGIVITRFNVTPFIATLGMLYLARGGALLRSNGATFPNLVGLEALGNTGFPLLGTGTILNLPYPIWLMIVFAIIATFVALKTPFGRQVYAVGGNERAAELSGVRVTERLTDSPACLAIGDMDMSPQMRRILAASGQAAPDSKPVLEINPGHALVQRLDGETDEARFADVARVLLDQATLAEGRALADPGAFVQRLNRLLTG